MSESGTQSTGAALTVVQEIQQKAQAYPTRQSIITSYGNKVLYKDLIFPDKHSLETSGSSGKPRTVLISEPSMRSRLNRFGTLRGNDWAGITKLYVPFLISRPNFRYQL